MRSASVPSCRLQISSSVSPASMPAGESGSGIAQIQRRQVPPVFARRRPLDLMKEQTKVRIRERLSANLAERLWRPDRRHWRTSPVSEDRGQMRSGASHRNCVGILGARRNKEVFGRNGLELAKRDGFESQRCLRLTHYYHAIFYRSRYRRDQAYKGYRHSSGRISSHCPSARVQRNRPIVPSRQTFAQTLPQMLPSVG